VGEPQVPLSDILQQSVGAEVPTALVGRADIEGSGCSIERNGSSRHRIGIGGDVRAGPERDGICPPARLGREEVYAPLIACLGTALARIAVGGIVARYDMLLAAFGECDHQPVVREGVRLGHLARAGTGKRECHVVPVLEFATDDGRAVLGTMRSSTAADEDHRGQRQQGQLISLHVEAPY
jgi:hypothetical protein